MPLKQWWFHNKLQRLLWEIYIGFPQDEGQGKNCCIVQIGPSSLGGGVKQCGIFTYIFDIFTLLLSLEADLFCWSDPVECLWRNYLLPCWITSLLSLSFQKIATHLSLQRKYVKISISLKIRYLPGKLRDLLEIYSKYSRVLEKKVTCLFLFR